MPVVVRKRRNKYRIVEAATGRIAKSKKDKAVDGGGHKAKAKATRQAAAINSAWSRKNR